MAKDKEAFFKELLNDFKIEASEHLQSISNGLLKLEKTFQNPESKEIIEIVFREIHSIKGAARAVNQLHIERLCMSMESVFYEVRKGSISLAPHMFDVFLQFTDMLDKMLKEIDLTTKSISENNIRKLSIKILSLSQAKTPSPKKVAAANVPQTIKPETDKQGTVPSTESLADDTAEDAEHQEDAQTKPGSQQPQAAVDPEHETIRVASSKLSEILNRAEELITVKSRLQHQAGQLQALAGQLAFCQEKFEERYTLLAGDYNKGDPVEAVREQEQLKKNNNELTALVSSMDNLQRAVGRSVDDLILSIRKSMMQPFSSLFMIVPRIVRDLSKEFNKEVHLDLQGADIEIDRRILEEMKAPLIHLIRNCIDHGMESRDERQRKNKSASGVLRIAVSISTGHKIHIRISDNGRGIDRERLMSAAVKTGKVTNEEVQSMSEKEINMLIFTSGVSTSPFITDVSGMGLGMAIVAEKIAGLGGSIDVESEKDKGTSFSITLPQTLATFKGVHVKASESSFLIPTSSITKALKILPGDIRKVESRNTTTIGNETIGLVSLADVLGIRKRHTGKKSNTLQGLVINHAHKKLVFIVEDVFGEQEGVVKPLGLQAEHVRNIAGAILSGDGTILPVLNVAELMESAAGKSYRAEEDSAASARKDADKRQTQVLVAEDSITVRNMLRNYLESAGFVVITAVDGLDAFERLQTNTFDIVVSDVEMPRMNGFELTEKIREDAPTSNLPVILVTALESADDRRRGMEAGANAYIVKSSFEKGNLIETIKRLTL
jgi:two-component system, chemotaxis family, sensor kinase CheA